MQRWILVNRFIQKKMIHQTQEGSSVRLGLFSEDKHLKLASRCRQGKTFVILKISPISFLQGERPHPSKYIPSIGEMLGERFTFQTMSQQINNIFYE